MVSRHDSERAKGEHMIVTLVSRKEWGARESVFAAARMPKTVGKIYIHHEAAELGPKLTREQECREMRNIQAFHMEKRGWNDIAYSFVFFPSGRCYVGRGWGAVGAHTIDHNSDGYGFCFAGNFQTQEPTKGALASCVAMIRQGVHDQRFKAVVKLLPHSAVFATACPGKNLKNKIASMQAAVLA